MQKIINIKVKVGLKSSIIVFDLNTHYFKSHCLSYNTFLKMQTQGFKDFFYSKKPKLKDFKLNPLCNNIAELPKKKIKKINRRYFRTKNGNI